MLANATWSKVRRQWLALKQSKILRASPYLRQVLYCELASRLHALDLEPYEMNSKGCSVRGVEHLRERFSKRTQQVQKLAGDFSDRDKPQGHEAKIEILVRVARG